MIPLAESEGPDQTARIMRCLIRAFAVRICSKTLFMVSFGFNYRKENIGWDLKRYIDWQRLEVKFIFILKITMAKLIMHIIKSSKCTMLQQVTRWMLTPLVTLEQSRSYWATITTWSSPHMIETMTKVAEIASRIILTAARGGINPVISSETSMVCTESERHTD